MGASAASTALIVPPSITTLSPVRRLSDLPSNARALTKAVRRQDAAAFWQKPRIVASIAAARRQEHADCLRARHFDLVIVDEAHHLRDRTSRSWQLIDALNKRFLLLLSATPVQNDLVELYNLLTLLKPGIFKTLSEFRAAYMTPGKPRQPANAERLRELMRGAMIRNTRAVVALKLPRRHAATIRVEGGPAESAAYGGLAAAVRRFAFAGTPGRSRPSRCSTCSPPPGPRPPQRQPRSSVSRGGGQTIPPGATSPRAGPRSVPAPRRPP